ncbi:MAG: hypothetical protein DI551_09020 [Micavibrio aeruginosavorus]|uniref:Uncharacterized protein n=1 Tax=Micavibrio aeruginosavorus TaxID=349221 RepID=A0A2W5MX77_9BACT|nr:MAG: hypothetical protein DI551_09020 [Micavibrio aeruginosavorus]
MPIQPADSSDRTAPKAASPAFGKKKAKDNQANYGFSNQARLDTRKERTEEQEYAANGLAKTQRYSYDRVGQSHDDLNIRPTDHSATEGREL